MLYILYPGAAAPPHDLHSPEQSLTFGEP